MKRRIAPVWKEGWEHKKKHLPNFALQGSIFKTVTKKMSQCTHEAYIIFEDDTIRRMTASEALLAQGINPESMQNLGFSERQIFGMAGNAVCEDVSKLIFKVLSEFIPYDNSGKGVEICAGIGGLTSGIKAAYPIIPLELYECEEEQSKILSNRFKEDSVWCKKVTSRSRFGEVFVFAGGPPCQPYSAGANMKTATTYKRGFENDIDIMQHVPVWIEDCKAKIFVIENSPRFATNEFKKENTKFMNGLSSYEIRAVMINSFACGAPQDRKRMFIIGVRNDTGVDIEEIIEAIYEDMVTNLENPKERLKGVLDIVDLNLPREKLPFTSRKAIDDIKQPRETNSKN